MRFLLPTSLAVVVFCLASPVFANPIVTVDEKGKGFFNGTPLPFHIGPDPGPGGLPSVLIYSLPFPGTQGDVLLVDAGVFTFDVIRFNGDGTLIFYSDNIDGVNALADIGLPGKNYTNLVGLHELGTDSNNGAFYSPGTSGEPGSNPSSPVAYQFISDVVPEPASLILLAFGAFSLAGYGWMRRDRL